MSKEHAYAYEAGYHDGATHYELDHCPSCKNIADLQDALAENAKLRELLQDYHRYEHEDCHSCRYIDECRADESGRCIAPMRLGERYRELGIEVDK